MSVPLGVEEIADRIRTMQIRGAGEIARAAAQGLVIAATESKATSVQNFVSDLEGAAQALLHTRPTAVSLPNAIRFIMHRMKSFAQKTVDVESIRAFTISTGQSFINSSKMAKEVIGEIGARRIRDGDVLLTHCNSSATTSIFISAAKMGKRIRVFATETRPLYQGHLTVKELTDAGIDVTVIVDSAVRHVMHEVDRVVVGADAVAANGAVVNKIGTSLIALAAHEASVRFFVAAETFKFSPETLIGGLVEIEERSPTELVDEEFLKANPKISFKNPSFDITPPEYIDLIITERGVIPPQGAFLVLREEFGWAIGEEIPFERRGVKIALDEGF